MKSEHFEYSFTFWFSECKKPIECSAITLSELGKVIFLREGQFKNARSLTMLSFCPIFTSDNAMQSSKAPSSIISIELPIVAAERELHFAKTYSPTVITVSGKLIFERSVQP